MQNLLVFAGSRASRLSEQTLPEATWCAGGSRPPPTKFPDPKSLTPPLHSVITILVIFINYYYLSFLIYKIILQPFINEI